MFQIFLYIILGLYMGLRSEYLFEYLLVNRDMIIDIEKRKSKLDNTLKEDYLNPNKVFIYKWKKLYNKDDFLKKIGSSILALIPLAYFMYNSVTGENPSTLIIYVIYPVLIQIFNTVFDSVGIDNNLYISDMYKERILAKKYKNKVKNNNR